MSLSERNLRPSRNRLDLCRDAFCARNLSGCRSECRWCRLKNSPVSFRRPCFSVVHVTTGARGLHIHVYLSLMPPYGSRTRSPLVDAFSRTHLPPGTPRACQRDSSPGLCGGGPLVRLKLSDLAHPRRSTFDKIVDGDQNALVIFQEQSWKEVTGTEKFVEELRDRKDLIIVRIDGTALLPPLADRCSL